MKPPEQLADEHRACAAPSRAPYSFLDGGGDMGERMRAYDWSRTLGPPAQWPTSLKTAVKIMLASRQPIWIGWGPELIYLYNDPYKAIIGGRHPAALGQPTREVWPELWNVIGPMLESAMQGLEGTYVEEQLLIMQRHGFSEETYYTYSYTPIPNEDGGTGGIICANTDDTQRVIGQRQLTLLQELAATADLRNLEEVCRRAAAALATNDRDLPFTLIYLLDASGESVSLAGTSGISRGHAAAPASAKLKDNPPWPFAEVLQSNAPRLIGQLELRYPDLPAGFWPRPPGQAVALPIAVAGDGGCAGVLIAGLNPFRQYNEQYQSFLSLVTRQLAAAITNARSYDAERKRAESLAELNRAKTAFFSNVSHEFRTPLTLMLGPIEELRKKETSPEQSEQMELLHRNSLRLLKMVNTLLEFSRIEAGRIKANYQSTDLSACTAELASVFRSAIEKAGLRFEVDCPPLPERVYVDRDMWERIVLNLLNNALKFTFQGEIAVSLRWRGERVELTVRDTGGGIPASQLPNIFQRFFRGAGTAARTQEGSGIGLALVQELAHLHGGEARVQSEEGRGSTFTVSIKTGRAHLAPDRIGPESDFTIESIAQPFVEEALRWLPEERPPRENGGGAVHAPAAGGGKAARILLADDNRDMRDYVSRLLSPRFAVETAVDGQEALERIQSHLPDLVITDVMMPRLDGFELLQRLRTDERTRTLPVIMLSARAGEETRMEGWAEGADDYLTKPFSARELLARVESQLRVTRARREAEDQVRRVNEQLSQRLADLAEARDAAVKAAKEAETTRDALRKSRERFDLVRGAAKVGFWFCDLPFDKLIWDHFVKEHFWLPPDAEVTIDTFYEQLHPDDRERTRRAIETSIADKTPYDIEYRTLSGDGRVKWIRAFGRGFYDVQGRPVRFDGVTLDVTDRKSVEETLERTVAERTIKLRETVHELEAFSYSIAHDMRAPLRAIQGFSKILIENHGKKLDGPAQQLLKRMSAAANRMDRLIVDVLNYSTVVRTELPLEVIDVGNLVRGILDAYPHFHDGEAAIDVARDLPAVIGNEAALTQCLSNLIANAVKFVSPENKPRVRIWGETAGSRTRILVKDNGIGIEKDHYERIFGIFQRLDKNYEGTGIGLAIVRKAAERMGGSVGLDSEPGRGTTFWIELKST